MKTQHTPTPWKKSDRVPERHAIRIVGNGRLTAEARAAGGPWIDAEANADYIVRAVNSHEELVTIIKDFIKMPSQYHASVDLIERACKVFAELKETK